MTDQLTADIAYVKSVLPDHYEVKESGHKRKISTASHKRNSKKTTNYGDHGNVTYDSTDRYPRSVIKIPMDKQKEALHPTQKPVALMSYFIRTYTLPGAIVLDNVCGVGGTGVACEETGRNYLLILYYA